VAATLRVNLVTAERELWAGEASMVVAKTSEGEIGLLPGHEPMLAILVPGQVRVTASEGSPVAVDITEGGFLSIEHNVVTVVVREGVLVS
jgi:F-type H+-transporting ATPase subunit epsilon